MYGVIRSFFTDRDVLEVETPALSLTTVTDPQIHSLYTHYIGPGSEDITALYLQTSPEYAMKRLLAAGSGPIFQIAKSFRNGERGRLHNPEFTMLEWYRPGFDEHELMHEVEALVTCLTNSKPAIKMTYSEVFERYVGIDPHLAELEQLGAHLSSIKMSDRLKEMIDRKTCLELLFSHKIAPQLGFDAPAFIYDFSEQQSSLATLKHGEVVVARRFELFVQGMELANGCCELRDPKEQRQRFEQDQQHRRLHGHAPVAIDTRLLDALAAGLPDCAGVALGLDRLLMLVTGARDIDAVLTFALDRA